MPATPFDQSKAGLQDDHDPGDIGQRSANKKGGVTPTDAKNQKPDAPPDGDTQGGVGNQGGM